MNTPGHGTGRRGPDALRRVATGYPRSMSADEQGQRPKHNPGEFEFGEHAPDAPHNPGEPVFGEEPAHATDPPDQEQADAESAKGA